MKHLVNLLKKIEIYLRSNTQFDRELITELSELSDWDLRIVNDFILRVKMDIQQHGYDNNIQFLYKIYDIDQMLLPYENIKKDLFIVSLKRRETDTVLTDVVNRLVTPQNITWEYFIIHSLPVTKARNFAVEEALKRNYKYLLFIDDDIVAPNNALLNLWDVIHNYTFEQTNNENPLVVAANYYRKVEPLISAHVYTKINDRFAYADKICAMGFTLINLEKLVKKVPLPLFWEFGAPDGYWSMGEDAFFTKNMIHYTNTCPIIDLDTECLHYDKQWKKIYGNRRNDIIYATNTIENFENIRICPKFPLIAICIPLRNKDDIIATDLTQVELLRGYRTQILTVYGMDVDSARNNLVQQALSIGADYIFFLDNDVLIQPDTLNKLIEDIEQLQKTDQSIIAVTGDYYTKSEDTNSVHTIVDEDGIVKEINRTKLFNEKDYIQINWTVGFGCILIDTKVFKQLRYPWFYSNIYDQKTKEKITEDAWFTELATFAGYKIMLNKNIQGLHIDFTNKKIVYNKHLLDNKIHKINWPTKLNLFKFELYSNM